ncbi:MarR family transcriptional regulator [Actinomadura vinacea]|uniref:MarR family transcriptional regulator n=1 Tax=Actinomadura vinacea TaxID=115336 RepID=A0ABP5X3X5_9ACTN
MAGDGADAIQEAWRRELPDVPVDSIGVITRIWWAAKIFGDERRRLLAELGIDMATLDLLSTLRRSGPPYRMSPSELASASLVSRGAISQRVERAASSGLVTRERSGSGFHTHAVSLTDEGNALVERAVAELLDREQRLIGHLGATEQAQLADLLRGLLAGLTAGRDTTLGQVGG